MKNAIKDYLEPTSDEKKQLWDNGLVVFDTNVLLDLYRYSAETRDSLFGIFERLQDKVWIPYQVAYEFMKNRCKVIYDSESAFNEADKILKKAAKDVCSKLRLKADDSNLANLERFISDWVSTQKKNNLRVTDPQNDTILDKLLMLFNGKVGKEIDRDQLDKLKKEADDRFKRRIPPGYKDEKKKGSSNSDDNNAYGDYIIWSQLIEIANKTKKGVIFVTKDAKEDWWEIVSGKTIGPRVELRREFREKTGMLFHMYDVNRFIGQYNLLSENTVEQKVIDEIKRVDDDRKIEDIIESYTNLEKEIRNIESQIQRLEVRLSEKRRFVEETDFRYRNSGDIIPSEIQVQYDAAKQAIQNLEWELTNENKKLYSLQASFRDIQIDRNRYG